MNQSGKNDKEQPLVQHLIELRNRLLYVIYFLLAVFICLFPFATDIYAIVSAPLQAVLPKGTNMIATDVISPFLTPLKLTFYLSLYIAIPFILYQIWRFIAPGLYQHEKELAAPLMISSVVLFFSGMAFAYFLAHLPNSFFPIENRGEVVVLFCFIYLFLVAAGPGPCASTGSTCRASSSPAWRSAAPSRFSRALSACVAPWCDSPRNLCNPSM